MVESVVEAGTVGNERLLYLHVPKTGGHWVTATMQAAGIEVRPEGGTRHAGLRDVTPGERFTFAFVREPLSWYASWWRHCRTIDRTWLELAPEQKVPHIHFVNLPFEQYVEAILDNEPGFLSKYYRAFVGPREQPISFVGRYERLADDLSRALHEAGESFNEDALRTVPPMNTYEDALRAVAPLNISGERLEFPAWLERRVRDVESEIYERFYAG